MSPGVRGGRVATRARTYTRDLQSLTRAVLAAGDRRTALRFIAARACVAAEGDLGAVVVRDTDSDDVIVSSVSRWSSTLGPSSELAARLLAQAGERPALIHISRRFGPAMVSRFGSPRHPRGVLVIARRSSARPFTDSDLDLLSPYVAEAQFALAFTDANREHERALLTRDRNRIARELHDGVIQSLYGIGMVLEGIKGDTDQKRVQDQMRAITASINLVIDDLRAYINDLTPSRLAKRGLGPELCFVAQEFQASSGVVTSVRLQDGVDEIKAEMGRDLVQILRESLSNVARHAAASRVTINLRCNVDSVCLEIVDDGRGIHPQRRNVDRGLANIVRRARAWGGTAEIGASTGGGTTVRVHLPRSLAATVSG